VVTQSFPFVANDAQTFVTREAPEIKGDATNDSLST
jgi:hypothetical protein